MLKKPFPSIAYVFFAGLIFTAVLNIPIRDVVGNNLAAVMPTACCLGLFACVLVSTRSLKIHKLDIPLILLALYMVFHIAYSFLTYQQVDLIFKHYRIYFFELIIYVFVRQELTKDYNRLQFFKTILTAITLIVFLDIFLESFAFNILKMDIGSLIPWIDAIPAGEVEVEAFGNMTRTGTIRVPTIYGMPHKAGLVLTAGFAFFLFCHEVFQEKKYLYFSFAAALGIFLADSKLGICVFFVMLFFLRKTTLIKKMFRALALVVVSMVVVFLAKIKMLLAMVMKYSGYISGAIIENFIRFDDRFLKLVPFPEEPLLSFDNLRIYLFGTGITTSNIFGQVYRLFMLEIGLIAEYLPQYGFCFVFLFCLLYIAVLKRRHTNASLYLKITILPFYLFAMHYWLTFRLGVWEFFVAYYAILVATLIQEKRQRTPNL